jgi:hypothetical protein
VNPSFIEIKEIWDFVLLGTFYHFPMQPRVSKANDDKKNVKADKQREHDAEKKSELKVAIQEQLRVLLDVS